MSINPLSLSPIVVLLAVGLVYIDTSRLNLPRNAQLRWSVIVGTISAAGFFFVTSIQAQLAQGYILVTGQQEHVLAPGEIATGVFILGVVICCMSIFIYKFQNRSGRLAA